MKWQLCSLNQYPGEVWHDWDQLNSAWHNDNPMLSSQFISLLSKYTSSQLYVAFAAENEEKLCMLLLERIRFGIWQVFKPSQATLAAILLRPNLKLEFQPLVDLLPGFAGRLDYVSLDPLEHGGFISGQIAAELAAKAKNMRINVADNFELYWEQRPKKLKANIKRYENRLSQEQGSISVNFLTDEEDVKQATDRYGMLEARSWKGKNGTALHPANYQGQFYREFLSLQARNNAALVIEMYLADRLIASRLCCYKNGVLVALKTTYDESLKRYAVGRILLKHLITWSFEQPQLMTIDFYTNASPEQLEWSTEQRPMYDASMYANNISGLLLSSIAKVKQRLKASAQAVSHNENCAN